MKPKLRNKVHVFDHVTEGIPSNTLGSLLQSILLHFLELMLLLRNSGAKALIFSSNAALKGALPLHRERLRRNLLHAPSLQPQYTVTTFRK